MTNKEAISIIKIIGEDYTPKTTFQEENEALDLAIKALENQPQWIPVTTRELTAGEIADLMETTDLIDADDIEHWCYDCPLPDDNQDVLIMTKYGICLVTFYNDRVYGCYFDDYTDRDDVIAWMPLPEPYKKEES